MTTEFTTEQVIPCEHGNYGTCDIEGCEGSLTVAAPTLFDQALEERDKGMKRVNDATAEAWKRYADDFILAYAKKHRIVFVDDLWDAGLTEPLSPRALGPRMKAAAVAGWITKTDRVRPSVRSHLTGKPIWVSNVYEDDILFT